jgi:Fe-Mn family superoxide dismutase
VFKLPPLPYAYDALAPAISADTMRLHHDKHHAKYVETTNALLAKEGMDPSTLEEAIIQSHGSGLTKLHNNAAQAWNHAFFWSCMTPGGSPPSGGLAETVERAFGGLGELRKAFISQGEAHFGSGWVWIAATAGGLAVRTTHDGDNLVGEDGVVPLLACDLWEHAYYLDYQNDRKTFLQRWFDALPDWSFVAHQLDAANGKGEPWRYPAPDEPMKKRA